MEKQKPVVITTVDRAWPVSRQTAIAAAAVDVRLSSSCGPRLFGDGVFWWRRLSWWEQQVFQRIHREHEKHQCYGEEQGYHDHVASRGSGDQACGVLGNWAGFSMGPVG
ncbi:hypothetical protein [Streptomyces colonosanans]|uniref:hypothetical protein n=1 Tax=Streptomyces colonosanans TaxID=1428652 RepID=UPI0015A6988D|nr:hypothetical protein [Streptomyces colonosanans]